MKRIILNIGELAVSKESATLETILGSCVAVCLWDEQQRIGGLNHYLLPSEQPGAEKSTVYGGTSIDTLIEHMRKFYCESYHLEYIEIKNSEHDHRARRITEYLNLLDRIVRKQFEELKASAF